MANGTMEDWFLRGGEKPAKSEKSAVELAVCQNCGGMNLAGKTECMHCGAALTGGCPTDEYCGDDGDGIIKDWIVTMSRTKSVQQTSKVRVKAHSEEEAVELAEDRASREAECWQWDDVDYTEEHDDVEAVEAEVAR